MQLCLESRTLHAGFNLPVGTGLFGSPLRVRVRAARVLPPGPPRPSPCHRFPCQTGVTDPPTAAATAVSYDVRSPLRGGRPSPGGAKQGMGGGGGDLTSHRGPSIGVGGG